MTLEPNPHACSRANERKRSAAQCPMFTSKGQEIRARGLTFQAVSLHLTTIFNIYVEPRTRNCHVSCFRAAKFANL